MTRKQLVSVYMRAAAKGLVYLPDTNAIRRAWRAYKHNLSNPGDCAGDDNLLAGLAIAQAYIGVRPGWIPEVQRIGCAIAAMLD